MALHGHAKTGAVTTTAVGYFNKYSMAVCMSRQTKKTRKTRVVVPPDRFSLLVRCGVVWCGVVCGGHIQGWSVSQVSTERSRGDLELVYNEAGLFRGRGPCIHEIGKYQVQYKLSKKNSSERVGVTCRIFRGVVSFLRVSHAY